MSDQESKPATAFLKSKIDSLLVNQKAHYSACEKLLRRHWAIGILIVCISTASTGFIFSSPVEVHEKLPLMLSLSSLVVAILAGVQTFSGYAERSAEHKEAAVSYGILLREVQSRISGAYTEDENLKYLDEFKLEWAEVSKEAPLTFLSLRKKDGGE